MRKTETEGIGGGAAETGGVDRPPSEGASGDTREDASGPAKKAVPILLVDDHAIWRDGIRSLLRRTEFVVVGEAATAAEALRMARALRPWLALLDVWLAAGGGDGLDALQAIKRECPRTAVLMLTTYDDPHYLARAVAGGAAGYLLKGVARGELLRSLRAVAAGEMLLTRDDLARGLGEATVTAAPGAPPRLSALSARETEVLRLLASGCSNREIASSLGLSGHTVKSHVDKLLGKRASPTGCRRRSGPRATAWRRTPDVSGPTGSRWPKLIYSFLSPIPRSGDDFAVATPYNPGNSDREVPGEPASAALIGISTHRRGRIETSCCPTD